MISVKCGPKFGQLTLVERLDASVKYYEEAQRQKEAKPQGPAPEYVVPTVTPEQLRAIQAGISEICTRALRRIK